MNPRCKSKSKANAASETANPAALVPLKVLAAESALSYRFLFNEIGRGRLRAIRVSATALRVRRRDWEAYLEERATVAAAN